VLPAIQKLRDVNVVKIIEIGLKLYDKYGKVNIEKLYQRINEKIAKQKE
jgi:3-keto-L-gulonate-6-phosphate decarboxylase